MLRLSVLRSKPRMDAIVLLKGAIILVGSESGHLAEPIQRSARTLSFTNDFFDRAHQPRVDRGCDFDEAGIGVFRIIQRGISEDQVWIFAPEACFEGENMLIVETVHGANIAGHTDIHKIDIDLPGPDVRKMGLVLQRIDIGQGRAPGDRANTHEASGHHLLENVRIAFMCVMALD